MRRRLFTAASLPLALPVRGAEGVLRIGGFVVAPLVMGEAEHPLRGALRDFIEREVAPRLGQRLVWMPVMSFARARKALRDRSMDILLVVSGPGNAEVPHTEWSYLDGVPTIVLRPESPLQKIDQLEQLAGMRIAGNAQAGPPREMRELPVQWQLTSTTQWQQANLRMLAAGHVDAALFYNEYSPRFVARQLGLNLRQLPLPIVRRYFRMAYAGGLPAAQREDFERVAGEAFKGGAFRRFLDSYVGA